MVVGKCRKGCLRNTIGIPPRIGLEESKAASLLRNSFSLSLNLHEIIVEPNG